MEAATLAPRTLAIEGMAGDVCVNKVTAALKGVPDVITRSVNVGSAAIECDQDACTAACTAIAAAGYKARENGRQSSSNSPMNTTMKPQSDRKPESGAGTPAVGRADATESQMGFRGSKQKPGEPSEGEQCTPGPRKS